MSDMISRDAVAKAVATLSQEFLDGGSPTAVKVLNLAIDRIRAIPAADARAEALKEAADVASAMGCQAVAFAILALITEKQQ